MSLSSEFKEKALVSPERLELGRWSHEQSRYVGEGDIAASYSGDRIGMGQPIRKPFTWRGALWTSVCTATTDGHTVRAYRIVAIEQFDGIPVTHQERADDGEAARSDPAGFYHGITVRHRGRTFVLEGPPVCFAAGPKQQLDLFGPE